MLNKRKQEYLIMPVFDFSNDTSEIKEEAVGASFLWCIF